MCEYSETYSHKKKLYSELLGINVFVPFTPFFDYLVMKQLKCIHLKEMPPGATRHANNR